MKAENYFENDDFGNAPLIRDRVYDKLKMEIIKGIIQPGETLNIMGLSNQLNISAAPIREALNMLNRDGLVDLAPHRKPVVAVGTPLDFSIAVDMRMILEPYATRLSTPLIPQEAIDDMRAMLQHVLDNPLILSDYVESDLAVHEMLHIYSGSKLLSEILNTIKSYAMRFRYQVEKRPETGGNESMSHHIIISTQEHMAIVNALDTRDPDLAAATVQRHLELYKNRNTPA